MPQQARLEAEQALAAAVVELEQCKETLLRTQRKAQKARTLSREARLRLQVRLDLGKGVIELWVRVSCILYTCVGS